MKFEDLEQPCIHPIETGIRTAFKRSSVFRQAMQKARVEKVAYKKDGTPAKRPAVFYRCTHCKAPNNLHKQKDINVDHITPAIPIRMRLKDLTPSQLVTRIFTLPLQILCKPCHKVKTKKETAQRKAYRDSKK